MLNLEQVSPSDQIPSGFAKGQRNTSQILKDSRQKMQKALKNLKKDISIQ